MGTLSLPSRASAGFKVTDSEPEPLSSPSAILKSLAATAVWETSMPPSNMNLPASSGGRGGSGWPVSLTRVAMKVVSCSAVIDATPATRAAGPSSLSVPLKPSLPPPACSVTSALCPVAPLRPRARSRLSGAPFTVAPPASAYGPSSEPIEAEKFAFSATTERPALESLKISVPLSIVRRPSDSGLGVLGLAAAGLAAATDGVNSQFGLPSALISRTILGSTSVTSLASILPVSRASSEGFTVTDFTSTMFGFLEPATLKNFTPLIETSGTGSSDSLIGPSSTRSRPVAFFTSAAIVGL